uniref:HAD-IA family hydrolase n=1 Tax=Weissella soli TaxID=155866 RepID=UPI0035A0C56A
AGKPDPEIFVRAAAILDLPNEQIIGLEDSAAGIKSINAAGQTSLGIAAAGVLPEAKLHFTATSQVTVATIATKMNQ